MPGKFVIILALLFSACNGLESEKKFTVQGIYVTSYESEYSKAMDTVVITPLNEKAGTFNYSRHTGYRRISGGVLGPYEYKKESSTCIFNEKTFQLSEERHGRVYSFSDNGNRLTCGNSIYKRIQ